MPNYHEAFNIIILAAGNGKRMQSNKPKVLQELAGLPLLEHVIKTAQSLSPQEIIVVYGHEGELLQQQLSAYTLTWVEQADRLGTGHAVQQALDHLINVDRALILYGDVPLISIETLIKLCEQTPKDDVGLITATLENPEGLGRIVRDERGMVSRIVEEKDASENEKTIREINSGIMLLPSQKLQKWLPQLSNANTQNEYYLTDVINMAVNDNIPVHVTTAFEPLEVSGVNTKLQLVQLERAFQLKQAHKFIEKGLNIIDPARFDCRGQLSFGTDVVIDVNVVFEGEVHIGNNVTIEPNVILRDVTLGDNVVIATHSLIEKSTIKDNSAIGPYARIRPESIIGPHARVGNFVEVKKSVIAEGSKVCHLSYVGDAVIGRQVNLGAGTITVNYDGAQKYQTIIEDGVFVGCGSQLVAPVCLQEGSFIAAGTTVTKDVPAGTLTLSRVAQKTIDGWVRPSNRKDK